MKILSDLDESTLEYEADYEYNKESSDHLALTAPEDLKGISATVAGKDRLQMTLEYDGTALETPSSSLAGFLPADAVPYLLYDLRASSPSEIWSERVDGEDTTVLRYLWEGANSKTEKQVWLADKTFVPVCAELFVDGKRVLRCVFSGFQGQS
ncbi:MAG: hypothetical protein AB7C89_07460 [Intestinibacillus sp.]